MSSYKITTSGQFTLPADIRRRWRTRRVRVEDHGDHVVVRPVPDDPIEAVRGIFKDEMKGMTTDELRRIAREDERRAEDRKLRRYRGV
jgi:bifunctional DNA-binding transcriptional regulator/antitoxin component of YhaV-PrlF toxin-antitoxin module